MEEDGFGKLWKAFEIIAIGCILFGLLVVLYLIKGLLTPFIIAFVITFFLSPVVDYMEGEGVNRTLAVIFLIFLTIILLFILWKLTWPTIQTEISNLQKNAPAYSNKIQGGLERGMKLLEKKTGFIPEGVMQKAMQQKMNDLTSRTREISSLFKIGMGLMVNLILVQVIVFFFLKDGRRIKKVLITYVPNKYFETFLTLIYEIHQQISNYIRGQFTDALIVGVLSIIAFYLFGINYAMFIGAVVGVANIVPYFGPLLGFGFGGLLVLIDTGSIFDVLKFVAVLGCVKLIDTIAISPLTVSRSVNVHPLMVMIVISLGGMLHGVWGMLLSVPLYCSMRVSLRILYRGFVEYGNW